MKNKMNNSAMLKKADLRAALEYMKYNKLNLNDITASGDTTFSRETKRKKADLWASPRRQSGEFSSIMKKTDYTKVKPSLKKYCPDEWGRFLDNHYDPTLHNQSFAVSTKIHEP